MDEIKNCIISKNKQWIIVTTIFCILGIINYGFVSTVISWQTCNIIMIFLVAVFGLYSSIVYEFVQSEYMKNEEQQMHVLVETLNNLQNHIDESKQKNVELQTQTLTELKKVSFDNAEKIVQQTTNIVGATVKNMQSHIDELEQRNVELQKETLMEFKKVSFGNVEKIVQQTTNLVENAEKNLQEKINVNRQDLKDEIERTREEVLKKVELNIEEQSKKMEDISNKVAINHNKLLELLTQISDVQDENYNKIENYYNRVFEHVVEFSKNTKEQIEQLKCLINDNKIQIDAFKNMYESSAKNQHFILNQVDQNFDKFIDVSQNQQIEINFKLENLQNQILSLNSLAEVLKNLTLLTQKDEKQDKIEEKLLNPNRIEKISDDKIGITVFNNYKNNRMISSEMIKENKKMYDVEYAKDGSIACSRNYDKNGSVVTELSYHPNGQVKKRKETIMDDGTRKILITDFDEKGNKVN